MEPFVLERNKWDRVSLVDSINKFHESISTNDARRMAQDSGLDLVCFSAPANTKLALCKIVNYGKWRYQQEKDKKKNKSQSKLEAKEMQFTPAICDNDIAHKVKQVNEFLSDGHEVTIIMKFRGIHRRMGAEGDRIIAQIMDMVKDFGEEVSKKRAGDNLIIRLKKKHNKKEIVV